MHFGAGSFPKDILHRYLRFAVGEQPGCHTFFAQKVKALTNFVRQHKREREILLCFVCGVAVDGPLVTRPEAVAAAYAACDIDALVVHEGLYGKAPRVIAGHLQRLFHDRPKGVNFSLR